MAGKNLETVVGVANLLRAGYDVKVVGREHLKGTARYSSGVPGLILSKGTKVVMITTKTRASAEELRRRAQSIL